MQQIKEGKATIEVGQAFYNPKMSKLRDISVLFLKSTSNEKARLLDSTAATGVRGIRYALEAGIRNVTFLEINPDSFKSLKKNLVLNGLKAKALNKSIREFSGKFNEEGFDVIDVDPFGSPAPLIHDILKMSKDGTLLMVTATDTATLCGAEGKACLRIYGSKPVHNAFCHEAGLRILLFFIAREATQFNFGIVPLLSVSDMHYMRVFLMLKRGGGEVAGSLGSFGFGVACPSCQNFHYEKEIINKLERKCDYCGANMLAFGPLWLGGLNYKLVIAKMLAMKEGYSESAARLLEKLNDELNVPFFYSIPKITRHIGIGSVPMVTVIEILKKKSRVTRTHFDADAIKTSLPIGEVVKAVRGASRARP